MDLKIEVLTDSSAAKGILQRRGSGKVKHLEAKQLWVQELVAKNKMVCRKIPRNENPSDAMTHHWSGIDGQEHFKKMGLVCSSIFLIGTYV